MPVEEDEYDPFAILDAPAPPPDVTPVVFGKGPITGFRKPDDALGKAFAAQTRMFFGKRNRYFRHSYTTLPPGHIRIVIIRPGEVGKRLELDLMVVPFEDPQTKEPHSNIRPYEALSYEWDDGPAVFPVVLRDYTIRSPSVAEELAQRYPINEQEKLYPRGSEQRRRASSAYWRRALFHVCRTGRKMLKDEKGDYVLSEDKKLIEGQERFGTIALIQSNLRNALEQLRDKKEPVRLWADALCINQPNNEEKMQQIAIMGQIYNRATNVRIWLGGRSEQSDVAMEYVREIQEEKAFSNIFHTEAYGREVKTKWPALAELMRSRWFSRRWVVQELALARRASVYCGDKKISWTDFSSAIAIFMDKARPEKLDQYAAQNKEPQQNNGVTKQAYTVEKPGKTQLTPEGLRTLKGSGANALVAAYADLVRLGDNGVVLELKKNLEELVSTLTPFDCGDPRDIIYAILSVAAYSPQEHISPDTNKSLLQTYTEFVEYCVLQNESLNMICRYWAPQSRVIIKEVSKKDKRRFESKLPSWIKCLEESTYGTPDKVFVGQKEADSLVGPPSRSWYKASGSRKPSVTFGKNLPSNRPVVLFEEFDGTASAVGIKLGDIREVSPRMIPGIVPQEAIALGGWLHSGVDKKFHVEDVPEKLWRTLIANKTKEGYQPPPNYPTYCLKMLQQEDVHGDIHLDKIFATIDADDGMSHFLHRVRDVCFNRKVFVGGATGDLVGLCPKQTRVGDLVCILYGCSVPVVLRPCRQMPTLGLTPDCNNDPSERPSPLVSRKSTSTDQPKRCGTLELPDDALGTGDPFKQYTDENPWLDRPLSSAPVASETLTRPSGAVPGSSETSLELLKGRVASKPVGPPRALTFAAPKGKVLPINGGKSMTPAEIDAKEEQEKTNNLFYEVVGECFVCDKMDGEACPGKDELPWEERFTLI